jgi:hypothetical protein
MRRASPGSFAYAKSSRPIGPSVRAVRNSRSTASFSSTSRRVCLRLPRRSSDRNGVDGRLPTVYSVDPVLPSNQRLQPRRRWTVQPSGVLVCVYSYGFMRLGFLVATERFEPIIQPLVPPPLGPYLTTRYSPLLSATVQ